MKIMSLIVALLVYSSLWGQSAPDRERIMRDIRILSSDSLEGRKVGTIGAMKARNYIKSRFEAIGLRAYSETYTQAFTLPMKEDTVIGVNVVGYLPGESEKTIVITAHYDHLGIRDREIYNGADDNASGVAGLLAVAEAFRDARTYHTLIFAAFDAEETGLKGAKAFVDYPVIPLKNINLNINLDMISHNDKNEIFAAGGYHYEIVKPIIKKVRTVSTVNVRMGHDSPNLGYDDWTNSSDHGPFHAKNIPFIYFGVEDHADYHKPTDEFDNINKEFVVDVIDMIIETVKVSDQMVK